MGKGLKVVAGMGPHLAANRQDVRQDPALATGLDSSQAIFGRLSDDAPQLRPILTGVVLQSDVLGTRGPFV